MLFDKQKDTMQHINVNKLGTKRVDFSNREIAFVNKCLLNFYFHSCNFLKREYFSQEYRIK